MRSTALRCVTGHEKRLAAKQRIYPVTTNGYAQYNYQDFEAIFPDQLLRMAYN
jgi:hypothetical protein